MQEIIEILMQRDGISYADAKMAYLECKEVITAALECEEFFDVEALLRSELGLEPDYIMNFI